MGIPKLKSFVEEHFKGWRRRELKGHLVIDGYNLRHHLNKVDWTKGGQLFEFRGKVISFYRSLIDSGIIPIVVLDGIDHMGEKRKTIIKRQKSRMNIVRNYMLDEKMKPEKQTQGIFPALGSSVYMQTLAHLGVNYIVVDGEADDSLVKIANFFNCPLLSSDSDFYIYKLSGGYVTMDRLYRDNVSITADLYYFQDFCSEFGFQDDSCRLIIPALLGGDIISAVVDFQHHLEFFVGDLEEFADGSAMRSVVNYASSFESLSNFMEEVYHEHRSRRATKIRDNCHKSLEIYDSDEKRQIKDFLDTTDLRQFNQAPIPGWVLREYRVGHLSKFLYAVMVIGSYIFDTYIDDPNRESAVVASRPIRRIIYGILGLESATECFRVEYSLSDEDVQASTLLNDRPLPSLSEIPSLSTFHRENLLCSILGCDERATETLDKHWKLALAATVYWNRVCQPPPHLVESLLLCFLVCYHRPREVYNVRRGSPEFRTSEDWIQCLHLLAQWQCCYKDAVSLNQLLMCPFQVICPSQLYNGKLVMYFAEPRHINADFVRSYNRDNVGLFFKLRGVVLPQLQGRPTQRGAWGRGTRGRGRGVGGMDRSFRETIPTSVLARGGGRMFSESQQGPSGSGWGPAGASSRGGHGGYASRPYQPPSHSSQSLAWRDGPESSSMHFHEVPAHHSDYGRREPSSWRQPQSRREPRQSWRQPDDRHMPLPGQAVDDRHPTEPVRYHSEPDFRHTQGGRNSDGPGRSRGSGKTRSRQDSRDRSTRAPPRFQDRDERSSSHTHGDGVESSQPGGDHRSISRGGSHPQTRESQQPWPFSRAGARSRARGRPRK